MREASPGHGLPREDDAGVPRPHVKSREELCGLREGRAAYLVDCASRAKLERQLAAFTPQVTAPSSRTGSMDITTAA